MGTLDNEVMIRLFSELRQALEKLKRLAQTPEAAFLEDFEKVDSAKYNFIVAIEAAVDISSHLIAERNLGTPEEYADVFRVMGRARVFDEPFVERLVEMARFRNLLVHLYWKADDRHVYEILQENLGDFKRFEDAVRVYLTG